MSHGPCGLAAGGPARCAPIHGAVANVAITVSTTTFMFMLDPDGQTIVQSPESCQDALLSHTMRALTVIPGQAHSAQVIDVPEPAVGDGPILVETLALGICGTDREIVAGHYGWTPPGRDRLILGH